MHFFKAQKSTAPVAQTTRPFQKQMQKPHKILRTTFLWMTAVVASGACDEAVASQNKFDVGFGYYNVTAKTSTSSGSTSGPGLYNFNFRRTLSNHVEIAIGYTIYFTGLVSGDSGSGLDIGMNYYPLTFSGPVEAIGTAAKIELEEIWRPYIGASFNQRNFQSVQTTYSGFGAVLGIERFLTTKTNINGSGKLIQLSGPRKSTGTEMDIALSVGFKF
jgi:hypothetical protein